MFSKKINKEDSTAILSSLKALMKLGNSLSQALDLQIEIEDGVNKKILSLITKKRDKENKQLDDLFLTYGIINDSERLILSYGKDTKVSVDYILSIRELSSNFNKTMVNLLMFPVISVFVGLGIAKFLLPVMAKPVNDFIKIAELKKGVSLDDTLNIPSAFFYIHHPEIIDIVIIVVILFFVSIFTGYKFLEKNNPSALYKIIPLKAYDDIPFVFTLMRSLNKGGLDSYRIYDILHKAKINRGWKLLFLKLKKQTERNKPIYTVFSDFSFPRQISVIIKTSVVSKSFWDNFDDMIEYSKEVNINKNKEILKRYGGLSNIVGYGIIMYFIVGILLLMFSMQNLISAMQ